MLRTPEYFQEHFIRGRPIGKGSFSKVYEAFCRSTNKKYALKEVIVDEVEEQSMKSSGSWFFLTEKIPDIIQALIEPHPCIGEIFFFFKRREGTFTILSILMEFLPMNLEQELTHFRERKKKFTKQHVLRVMESVLEGQTHYFLLNNDIE